SDSRSGIRLKDDELEEMDRILNEKVKKGQPLTHILSTHPDQFAVSLRSVYNYIDQGAMTIRNIDLRRRAGYKKRRKKHASGIDNQHYREGRSYEDFKAFMDGKPSSIVTEMDTVKGPRGHGQVMLTMILRRYSIMLIFIMPDCKQESVLRWINFLEYGIGTEAFKRLFSVLLTDNGAEFKCADRIELTAEMLLRTSVYYCDPMASWQKPHIEKNHEYIRYVIPKGVSLNPFTQEHMRVLMNHINSTKRESLGGKSPYEMVRSNDTDMRDLMKLLKLEEIPADEVNLTPSLLKF
nr:IS30 family transposase [Lachnospiraceae bacterium]